MAVAEDLVTVVIKALLNADGSCKRGVSNEEYHRWIRIAKDGSMADIYEGYDITTNMVLSIAQFNTREGTAW